MPVWYVHGHHEMPLVQTALLKTLETEGDKRIYCIKNQPRSMLEIGPAFIITTLS